LAAVVSLSGYLKRVERDFAGSGAVGLAADRRFIPDVGGPIVHVGDEISGAIARVAHEVAAAEAMAPTGRRRSGSERRHNEDGRCDKSHRLECEVRR